MLVCLLIGQLCLIVCSTVAVEMISHLLPLSSPLADLLPFCFNESFLATVVAGSANLALEGQDVESMVVTFNASCTEVFDEIAPSKLRKSNEESTPG